MINARRPVLTGRTLKTLKIKSRWFSEDHIREITTCFQCLAEFNLPLTDEDKGVYI